MKSCKQEFRTAFSRQPAQYLLFDIGYPMTSVLINNVITAVKNVLILANSSRGGNRIPAFGLASINEQFQNILSPEIVRGNFFTISKAFIDLSSQAKFSKKLSLQDFRDHLYMAVNAVLEDFKSKVEIMLNCNWQFPSQIQITLVTAKNDTEIEQCLQKAVKDKNILRLKKIQVIQLSNIQKNEKTITNLKESQSPNKILSKENEFVTIIQMSGEEKELENLFKEWLLDSNNDHEHLHIVFPATTSKNSAPPLLKCDIGECLINPLSIPFGHRFQIHPDFCSIQLGGSGITAVNEVPIYNLQVIASLSSSSLCQSQLFGQPGRLYPTQCWHMEWEDLLANQQVFMALCKELYGQDIYLLTKLQGLITNHELTSHFILESDGTELLFTATVPAELMLPSRDSAVPCLPNDNIPFNVLTTVKDHLYQLPLIQDFSSSEFPSGLYRALSYNLQCNSFDGNSTHQLEYGFHSALEPSSSNETQSKGDKKRSRVEAACNITE